MPPATCYWFHQYGVQHFISKKLADDQAQGNPEVVRVNDETLFFSESNTSDPLQW